MKKALSATLLAVCVVATACSSGSEPEAPPAPTPSRTTATPNPYATMSDEARDSRLLKAAARGRTTEVAQLLDAGADVESRDSRDRTSLLLAVTHDRVEAARALVEAGADPDALDDQHDTPWLVTGVTGSVAMAKVVLRADPDLTIRNRFGGLSHIPASERGHDDYVAYVVENTDIEVDHVNDLGWTALLEAVILGKGTEPWQRIVETLVEHGADVSIADRNGITALQHARRSGFTEIAHVLESG